MIVPNKILACHHIKLQAGCGWCGIYKLESIQHCDRCKLFENSDEIFLSVTRGKPELICYGCHYQEVYGGKYGNA